MVPPATLEAFRDHGVAAVTLLSDLDQAREAIAQLEAAGISMDQVTQELEDEEVKAFADAFAQLLGTIEERRKNAVSALGPLADSVSRRISQLQADSVPTVYGIMTRHCGQKILPPGRVKIRMGWMDSPDKARQRLNEYQAFAKEIHDEKIVAVWFWVWAARR